jgi:hypothetical protein
VSVALVIQHAKRMRRIILSSVVFPTLQNFSTLSHKRHDFGKICVLISSTIFIRNIFDSKNNSMSYHKCTYVFVYSKLHFFYILMKLEFSPLILVKYKYQISSKSVQWECSMRTDRRMDGRTDGWTDGRMERHDEDNGRNFAKAPKNFSGRKKKSLPWQLEISSPPTAQKLF